MVDGTYQGGREEYDYEYSDFRTPKYLDGHAAKIIHDLKKVCRLYRGRKVHVFRETEGERCPDCTNVITGEQVYKDCERCGGTGQLKGYQKISETWSYLEVAPEHLVGTQVGTTDNPGGVRNQLVFVGEPILKVNDLVITEDTKKVFKLVEIAPQMVAMAGTVVTQAGQVSRITPGQVEYDLLAWINKEDDYKCLEVSGDRPERNTGQQWYSKYVYTDQITEDFICFEVPKATVEVSLYIPLVNVSEAKILSLHHKLNSEYTESPSLIDTNVGMDLTTTEYQVFCEISGDGSQYYQELEIKFLVDTDSNYYGV